jgi:hypothetical protein
MKVTGIIGILMFITATAFAQIMSIPFVPEEFDVDIFQYPHMILTDNSESEQFDTYYTFTDNNSSYQIRYGFLKQINNDVPNIRASFAFTIFLVMLNVAGYEVERISNYNDNDVRNEFNGDFGSTVFIQDPKSDFGDGYKYIVMSFFYKANQGIVVQSILFNDLDFVQVSNPSFMDIFHSFRFHE